MISRDHSRDLPGSYLVTNGNDPPSELRQLAGGIILSNPQRYSSVVLGKEREKYVEWLLKEESWGGAYIQRERN